MFLSSSAIQNGAFEDKYGKRGTQFSPNGMPTYSIPFEIHDAPQGTKSFAVVLEDKDAITASGFVWIHWLIADLERTVIQENESQTSTDYVQGANTWASKLGQFDIEEASFYGGLAFIFLNNCTFKICNEPMNPHKATSSNGVFIF